MDERTAFVEHNFAPPLLRRDIGILGLLHKRVLGKAHAAYQALLPFQRDVFGSLRANVGEHDKQLYGHELEIHRQYGLYDRSIFPMTGIYNKLPQEVVDCQTVSSFQTKVTKIAKTRCDAGDGTRKIAFHARRR